jgi:signal transduction histidine kinase
MNDKTKSYKISLILALTALITVMHYATIDEHPEYHFLHGELYFIPILLTSLWFGLKYGFSTAVGISLLYVPHIFYYSGPHNRMLTVIIQAMVFNFVAVVIGWLVDRQEKVHEEAMTIEKLAVVGSAAGAVGHELKFLLGTLRKLMQQVKEYKNPEIEKILENETTRMERIVDILSSYVDEEEGNFLSCDINKIIRKQAENRKGEFRRLGVALEISTDGNGCPSMVNPKEVERILHNIIQNAMEVSKPGSSIYIRSRYEEKNCRVEIQDEGPGIRPDHLLKIFTPFFTTKEKGHGLALAAGRKVMRDMGGDLLVNSKIGEGATFTMIIPRECSGKPLAQDLASTLIEC